MTAQNQASQNSSMDVRGVHETTPLSEDWLAADGAYAKDSNFSLGYGHYQASVIDLTPISTSTALIVHNEIL